jgi:hypothetical protein
MIDIEGAKYALGGECGCARELVVFVNALTFEHARPPVQHEPLSLPILETRHTLPPRYGEPLSLLFPKAMTLALPSLHRLGFLHGSVATGELTSFE